VTHINTLKDAVFLYMPLRACRGSRSITPVILNLSTNEGDGQFHPLVALSPGKQLYGTHWMGPRVGLDFGRRD